MDIVLRWLADNPIMLLFLLVGIGSALGKVKFGSLALGAAAVLFTSVGVSALGAVRGVDMEIPGMFGAMGLALFTFAVGISSGPSFFSALRTQFRALLVVIVAVVLAGLSAVVLGPSLGLTISESGGAFAGAVTNTAAMAAVGGTPDVTVGYSLTYIFGVLGILLVQQFALRRGIESGAAHAEILTRDVVIERAEPGLTVRHLEQCHEGRVSLTRVLGEDGGEVEVATENRELRIGDTVTVVGTEQDLTAVTQKLGRESTGALPHERAVLDFRRITVSDPHLAGRPLGSLQLEAKFSATASRVRRADLDMVANSSLVLQLGDRVRVVAPREQMDAVGKFLGDSSRGMTSLNAIWLGLGMAVGFAIGMIPFPLPGGGTFVLGAAMGCLAVGLVLGRLGRVGPAVITLPFAVTTVLTDLGLLLFLAQAGSRSGGQILTAVESGKWLAMLFLGVVVTLVLGVSVHVLGKTALRMDGATLVGFLAGAQTQPANLAYANARTGHDYRVSTAYSLAYPIGMVAKILTGAVIALVA